MGKGTTRVLALLSIMLLCGCATKRTLERDEDRLLLYSGIREDIQHVATCCGYGPRSGMAGLDTSIGVVGFLDFPFSLTLDTLFLPYTALRELWRPHAETE